MPKPSFFHRYANPAEFLRLHAALLPIAVAMGLLTGMLGLYGGLVVAPADYLQGEAVRIMYIHVPAAWMSTLIYAFIALASATFLIWRHTLAELLARQAAAIGAVFTLITLLTGMLWGKPTWGAYWVWDARLTSMLLLFFLYLGYLGLASMAPYQERTKTACAWLAIVGAVNLPIIKFSVDWWNTLHQPASILRSGGPSIHSSMLVPLILMILSFAFLFIALLLVRAETALKQQKLRRLQIQKIARKNAALEEPL